MPTVTNDLLVIAPAATPPPNQLVLFDQTWSGDALGAKASVELRILSQDARYIFQLVTIAFGQTKSFALAVGADLSQAIPLAYGLSLNVVVTEWKQTATAVTFRLALSISIPFGLPPVTLANQTISLPVRSADELARMAIVPSSAAELYATLQLVALGQSPAIATRAQRVIRPNAIDPSIVLTDLSWFINTGDDDRRSDSRVWLSVVFNNGGTIEFQCPQVSYPANNPLPLPGYLVWNLPSGITVGSVNHFELSFQSDAHWPESTDSWDVTWVQVQANASALTLAQWGGGTFRFAGSGTLAIPTVINT